MNRLLTKELNEYFVKQLQDIGVEKISAYVLPGYPKDTREYVETCWKNDEFPEKYSIETYREALYSNGASYNPDKAIELIEKQIHTIVNNYIQNANLIKVGSNTSLAATMAQFGSDAWVESWDTYQSGKINDKDASNLWKSIEATIDDIGKEVYDKIANYIDNLSNIDLCNIKALNSICKYTKYNDNNAILTYKYPSEIEELINIFSINKDILLASGKVLNSATRQNITNIIKNKKDNSIYSSDPRVNDKTGQPIFTFKLDPGNISNDEKDLNAQYVDTYYKLEDNVGNYIIQTHDGSKYFKKVNYNYSYNYTIAINGMSTAEISSALKENISDVVSGNSVVAIYKKAITENEKDTIIGISYDADIYDWFIADIDTQMSTDEPERDMIIYSAVGLSEDTEALIYPYCDNVTFIPTAPAVRLQNIMQSDKFKTSFENKTAYITNSNNFVAIDRYEQNTLHTILQTNINNYTLLDVERYKTNVTILNMADASSSKYFGYTFKPLASSDINNYISTLFNTDNEKTKNILTAQNTLTNIENDYLTYTIIPSQIIIDDTTDVYNGIYKINPNEITTNTILEWKKTSNTDIKLVGKKSYAFVKPADTNNINAWLSHSNSSNVTINDNETEYKYNTIVFSPSIYVNNANDTEILQFTTPKLLRQNTSFIWAPNNSFQLFSTPFKIKNTKDNDFSSYQFTMTLSYNVLRQNTYSGYWKLNINLRYYNTNSSISINSIEVDNADTDIANLSDKTFWKYNDIQYIGQYTHIIKTLIFDTNIINSIQIYRDCFRYIFKLIRPNASENECTNSLVNIKSIYSTANLGPWVIPPETLYSILIPNIQVKLYLPDGDNYDSPNSDNYTITAKRISEANDIVSLWSSKYYSVSRNTLTDDEYKTFIKDIFIKVITNICKMKYRQFEDDILVENLYDSYIEYLSTNVSADPYYSLSSSLYPQCYTLNAISAQMINSNWYEEKLSASNESINPYIYKNKVNDFSNEQLFSTELKYDSDERKAYMNRLKFEFNVPTYFNEQQAFENIYFGNMALEDYTADEQAIISEERNYRNEAQSKQQYPNLTKYYKLRELKVKEYFRFLLKFLAYTSNDANVTNDTSYGNIELADYNIDPNYFEIKNATSPSIYTNDFEINENIIIAVATTLANACVDIANMRERLKLQTYRIYKKGTWNLIRDYIIEYIFIKIINNIKNTFIESDDQTDNTIKLLGNMLNYSFEVNLVEYSDNTEYFNIMSKDKLTYSSRELAGLNPRYWEIDESDRYLTMDNLSDSDISAFYFNTLGLKLVDNTGLTNNTNEALKDFLSTIFESAAVTDTSFDYTNSGDEKYKTGFAKYSGITTIGERPYYNYKNTTHPTYQLHQFIYNFTKYIYKQFAVDNIFLTAQTIYAEEIQDEINTYIDDKGNIINKWINNRFDFTGYNTAYESTITDSKYVRNDGPFNMYAFKEFLDRPDYFIKSVREHTDKYGINIPMYYKDAVLTDEEFKQHANILSNYRSLYENIQNQVIYKFGYDKYNNAITLYKTPESGRELKDIPGILWFRPYGYALSVPMFICKELDENIVSVTEDLSDDNIIKQRSGNSAVDGIKDLCINKSFYKYVNKHVIDSNPANNISLALDNFLDFEINFDTNTIVLVTEAISRNVDETIDKLSERFKELKPYTKAIDKVFTVKTELYERPDWKYATSKILLFNITRELNLTTYVYEYFMSALPVEQLSDNKDNENENMTTQLVGVKLSNNTVYAVYLEDQYFRSARYITELSPKVISYVIGAKQSTVIDNSSTNNNTQAKLKYAITQQIYNNESLLANDDVTIANVNTLYKPIDVFLDIVNSLPVITTSIPVIYDTSEFFIQTETILNSKLVNYLGTNIFNKEITSKNNDNDYNINEASIAYKTVIRDIEYLDKNIKPIDNSNFINVITLDKMFAEITINGSTASSIKYFNALNDNNYIPLYPANVGANYFWEVPSLANKTEFNIQYIGKSQAQAKDMLIYEQGYENGEFIISKKLEGENDTTLSAKYGYPLSAFHALHTLPTSAYTVNMNGTYYSTFVSQDAFNSLSSTITNLYDDKEFIQYTDVNNTIISSSLTFSEISADVPDIINTINKIDYDDIPAAVPSVVSVTAQFKEDLTKYSWLTIEQHTIRTSDMLSGIPDAAGIATDLAASTNSDSAYNYGKFEIDKGFTINVSYILLEADETNTNEYATTRVTFSSPQIAANTDIAVFTITDSGKKISDIQDPKLLTLIDTATNIEHKYLIRLVEFSEKQNYKIKFNVKKVS